MVLVHEPPAPRSPHDPFTQVAGAVHCALVVHLLLQVNVAVSQRPGAQFVVPGTTHVPVPLHCDGGICVDAVGQLGAPHWVPEVRTAHCPDAHWPVVPQVACACAAHIPCGSAPLFTLLQMPVVAGRLQA